jgi:uncharacterized membrane protein
VSQPSARPDVRPDARPGWVATPGVRHASDGTPLRVAAPRRLTSAVMSVGVAVSAACFVLAGVAETLGVDRREATMTDYGAIIAGLLALDPWALACLGTYAVIVTPALALLTTAREYASIADRRTVGLALAVLSVLALSVVVAILR